MEQSDELCVVCQEPFDGERPTATTPCNHLLHSSCLLDALRTSNICPLCRAPFYPEEDDDEDEESQHVEIDILSTIGEDALRTIREEVSRLANSGGNVIDSEDVHVIEINESPPLRRSRLKYTLFKACKEGNLEEVRRLIHNDEDLSTAQDDSFDTLLHRAVFSENEALLRFLTNEVGVSVNSINNSRMTPLHYAVSAGTNLPALLLNCGAFVDAQDAAGKTPLMSACGYDNAPVAQLLLDRGASTRTFDSSGDTCMHHAARGKCLSVIKLLLRRTSADPSCLNFLEETPLHLACATGSHTIVRFLLEAGASPAAKTKAGKSPVNYVPGDNTRLPILLDRHTA